MTNMGKLDQYQRRKHNKVWTQSLDYIFTMILLYENYWNNHDIFSSVIQHGISNIER